MRYTMGEFHTEVIEQAKKLNITDRLNKSVSYYDSAIICLRLNNDIMNEEQLYQLAVKNIHNIYSKFSYKGLRIWFYSFCNDSYMDRFNQLKQKYINLIKDIEEYHNKLISDKFNSRLEYFIYCSKIIRAFNNEFGVINDDTNSLWAILKVIKDSCYDNDIIKALFKQLKTTLKICGDRYYITKDLTNQTTLEELYLHLGEETLLDVECINLNQCFYTDDGYGNSYFLPNNENHQPSIENFKRW